MIPSVLLRLSPMVCLSLRGVTVSALSIDGPRHELEVDAGGSISLARVGQTSVGMLLSNGDRFRRN